jgi:transcriptional regulator with XRE-family HTH domain
MGENYTTMSERIQEIFKYAIASGRASSRMDLAEKCGITNVSLSRFLNGKAEPSKKTLLQMNDAIGKPFEEVWLLTGAGEKMASHQEPPIGDATITDAIVMLIQEMRESRIARDGQINRLLTLIEGLQIK